MAQEMQNNKQVRVLGKSKGITLKQHLRDTLEAFDKLNSKIKDEEVRKCVKLAIKLHDLGKALPYFQIIMMGNKEYEPFSVYKNTYIYHSIASLLFINKEKLREILDRKEDLANFVLSAVAYHHWNGSLERDMQATEKYQALLKDINLLEKSLENLKEELGQLFCDEEKSLLEIDYHMLQGLARDLNVSEYAVPPYRMDWIPLRKDISQDMARKWVLISGFLMRCDHYASYCEMDEDWNSKSDQERNERLKGVEIDNIKYEDILNNIMNNIKRKTEKVDNLWQVEKLEEKRDKSLILVAPTGCGKTEFAFLWSNGEKLIYTLPIRAIVEQTYERAKKSFGEEKVGLLHGDADVYLLREEESKTLQEASNARMLAQEKLRVYRLSKELSPAVIVSTGDQFFPYALRPPSYERIYATLSYSRLVIDEVQAYDPVACAIVVKFLEDIVRLGGKFLLITATLPSFVEEEISKRLPDYSFEKINLYEEEKAKYENLKKHVLKVDTRSWEDVLKEVVENAKNNKKVLVILNTIKRAEEIFKKLENIPNLPVELLHSELTLNEKQERKKRIENMLRENTGCVVVSTQVIEAGMDIDADILYTELCPMDVLVQRMGRVLRRYRENYEVEEDKNANVIVVLNQEESTDGLNRKRKKDKRKVYGLWKETVYDNELLEKTLILINRKEDFTKENANNRIWEEYYENFKQKEEKLIEEKVKELFKETQIKLSEYEKYHLVKSLYEALNPNGKYLSEFYNTLDVLDAGYMSDKREEAQEIFRRINNVSTIHFSKFGDLKEEIKKLIKEGKYLTYLDFKSNIIANFVVQKPFYKVPEKRKYRLDVCLMTDKRRILEEVKSETNVSENEMIEYEKKYEKIVEWSKDLFIACKEGEEEEFKKFSCFRKNII